MGVLTDLFIATEDDIKSVDMTLLPLQENGFRTVEGKGIDGFALVGWEASLTGARPPEFDPDREFCDVFDGGPEGPWVSRVRQELVAAFRTASDEKLIDAAVEWAREMNAEDEEVEIVQIFKEIRALAIEAVASNRGMFLWTCL
jgi:hypothetical protein